MRPFTLIGLLVVLGACRERPRSPPAPAPAPPSVEAPPHFQWLAVSGHASARLEQTARSPNECTLRCSLGTRPAWSRNECVGLDTDFAFVSDDCRVAVVLKEYPHVGETVGKTVVGSVLTATSHTPILLEKLTSTADVRGQYVRWLDGVLSVPGPRPQISDDGQSIEVTLADHRPVKWPLASFLVVPAGPR